MKKILTLFVLLNTIFTTLISIAQIPLVPPQAFNYQAILRNSNGNPMPNQNVSLKLSIIDSVTHQIKYIEKHDTVTNQFGLLTVEIGRGTALSGAFDSIFWGHHEHYLKTEIDTTGSGTYTTMGITQLISVPYAMYAQYAGPWEIPDQGAPGQIIPPKFICFMGNQYDISVSIGTYTPDPRAIFEISSSDKGVLFPRLTTVQRQAIDTSSFPFPNAINGLFLYDVDYNQFWYISNGLMGSHWEPVGGLTKNGDYQLWTDKSLGIGTSNPQTPLQISNGDVYIEDIGSGVIMKSPNGNCWRMTVDNTGNPVFTAVTCP